MVAKYCDENVSLRVCLRVSVCPRGYLQNHTRDLYQIFVHVAYMTVVARSSSGRVTKSEGEGAILGVFLPLTNRRTVLQTVAPERFALCYRSVVCPVCMSICDVSVLWPNGWMD